MDWLRREAISLCAGAQTAQHADLLLDHCAVEEILTDPPVGTSLEGATRGVRSLYAVWDRARGARQMPARADIDPAEIGAELLPYIMIGDFESDPFRVRFRLVGTRLVESAGWDFTGCYLDDMKWPLVPEAMKIYRQVWETGRPARGSFGAELTVGGWYGVGFAVLPLSASVPARRVARGAADMCLVVVDYIDVNARQFVRPVLGGADYAATSLTARR